MRRKRWQDGLFALEHVTSYSGFQCYAFVRCEGKE